MVVFTFRLQVTNKQTRRMVKTIPAAIPVTITTIELVDEDASVQSNIEVEPFTALESVTPATEKKNIHDKWSWIQIFLHLSSNRLYVYKCVYDISLWWRHLLTSRFLTYLKWFILPSRSLLQGNSRLDFNYYFIHQKHAYYLVVD